MLLYAYLFNDKNISYIVKSVKAVYLIDNRSILFTIRQESLKVLMDSLVGEEHYSQFKVLFKIKFREKEWDLQWEKRLQKMGRYPCHGEDNNYIVEYVEALRVAEDESI